MIKERSQLLTGVIAAHPNRTISSRARLQKTIWLLQFFGFPTDYAYTLFFRSPYSEELVFDLMLLEHMQLITQRHVIDHYVITAVVMPSLGRFHPTVVALSQTTDTMLELMTAYTRLRRFKQGHNMILKKLRKRFSNNQLNQAIVLIERLQNGLIVDEEMAGAIIKYG